MSKKVISPALFGLILICFLLPWVNVSCQNYKISSISGIEFVTGKTFEEPQMFKEQFGSQGRIPKSSKNEGLKPQLYVILALVCVITGFVLTFIKNKITLISNVVVSILAFLFIVLQKIKLEEELVRKSQGLIQIDYLFGFYLTLILLVGTAGFHLYLMIYEKPASMKTYTISNLSQKFCPECGAKNEPNNIFCKECGNKFP